MKNKCAVIGLLFLLYMAGCKKNEEIMPTSNSILGKWKTEKIETFSENKLINTEIVTNNQSCPNHYEFLSNNTYREVGYSTNCTETFNVTYNYTFSKGTLLFFNNPNDAPKAVLNVSDLTSNSMQVSQTHVGEEDKLVKIVAHFKKF